jgi:peptidoglycan L-alanyl-D-glutamate endopeptidase CwlK
MYTFGKRSLDNLSQAHLDLQVIFHEVIKVIDCSIICGHRGEIEQNEAFDKGFSKLKFPKSKHNSLPSMAVDCVPYPLSWDDMDSFKKLSEVVLSIANGLFNDGLIAHKLEWGGSWKWKDYPHYQLV